jgi:uncharacterized membrane protein YkvA (DUF1232 family)
MEIPGTYEGLRERITAAFVRLGGRFGARLGRYALAAPDLFVLAGRVLADGRVPARTRGEIIGAALYLASPVDLIPEAVFGPIGLVDDALVATRLFDVLLNGVEVGIVREHWPGDAEVLDALQAFARDGRRTFAAGFGSGVRRIARATVARVLPWKRPLRHLPAGPRS